MLQAAAQLKATQATQAGEEVEKGLLYVVILVLLRVIFLLFWALLKITKVPFGELLSCFCLSGDFLASLRQTLLYLLGIFVIFF